MCTQSFLGIGRHLFFVVGVVGLVSLATRADAAPPSKEQCIAASEAAQKLRHEGKLRDARAPFRTCGDLACPGPVRDDCAEQLTAVEAALPAVLFIGRAANGREVAGLRVAIDGRELSERDSSGAWIVDPGEHDFTIAAENHLSVSRRLSVASGEKTRVEVVLEESTPPATSVSANEVAAPQTMSNVRLLGFGLAGVGVVGAVVGGVFGFVAKSTYDDARAECPAGPSSCRMAGVDGGEDAKRQAAISTVAFASSAAVLAAGIVLVLVAPKDRAASARIRAEISASCVRLQGSW